MATSKDFVDAIVSGDVVTVKKMLKSSKNNRKFSVDLISLAIKEKQTVIAKLLIKHSVTTNKNMERSLTTSLFYAIRHRSRYSYSYSPEGSNDQDRIMLLQEAGADLNAKCSIKNHPHLATILDLAIYMGSTAAVTYLLYSSPVGHKQLDYSRIELAAFDENAVDMDLWTDAER
ncbi:hypothetical protein KQX54_013717 [Cotesia glomerata]|uniref:Uncharacterized protein n=1 Tax=Cotesia glomerata TaxID=32391 RepID=A0AAV7IJN4_COTGL|nr:hypothetical protein KQX54_013717 [Cotesia glomerata]